MRAKLRPVAAVVILTILIANIGMLALWLVGSIVPPVGAVAAMVAYHPAGWVLAYGFSALIAVPMANRQRKAGTLP